MYKVLIFSHIAVSMVFMCVAIYLTFRVVIGYMRNGEYTRTDKLLTRWYLILLYINMVLGMLMYFFVDPAVKADVSELQQATKRISLQFWAVEHLYVMTFALLLSQIGQIFVSRTVSDRYRFGYSLFYFGLATLITVVSMTFYLINR
jgi:hypothetical protein